MRKVLVLVGVLIALSPTGAQATTPKMTCPADKVLCVVPITVDMPGGRCKAKAPDVVEVPFNRLRPTLLIFVLVGGDDTVVFAPDSGRDQAVRFQPMDQGGTIRWDDKFDSLERSQDRVFFLTDRHQRPADKNKKFDYQFYVKYSGGDCDTADPTIHNTN